MKKQRIPKIIFAVLAAALCIILIIDSEGTVNAARQSVNVCLTAIIPSLFAFMVFSQVFIKSGIGDFLFYPLYRLNSFWFKGNRREFSIFIISLFGGYPVGIKLLKDYIAYNKNYTEIAEKMLCFCYCGSPSFIIQIVGISVLGSARAGLLVYLSNIAACVTLAVVLNVLSPKAERETSENNSKKKISKITVYDFTDSIADTVKALGVISGTILAFNIVLELIRFSGFTEILRQLNIDKHFMTLIEISNVSAFYGNSFGLLPFFAAATSFGGLCIIVQTAALSKGHIHLKKFIISRLPASLLSGFYMYIINLLFPISVEAITPSGSVPVLSAVDSISTACLIVMTYLLLKETKDMTSSHK